MAGGIGVRVRGGGRVLRDGDARRAAACCCATASAASMPSRAAMSRCCSRPGTSRRAWSNCRGADRRADRRRRARSRRLGRAGGARARASCSAARASRPSCWERTRPRASPGTAARARDRGGGREPRRRRAPSGTDGRRARARRGPTGALRGRAVSGPQVEGLGSVPHAYYAREEPLTGVVLHPSQERPRPGRAPGEHPPAAAAWSSSCASSAEWERLFVLYPRARAHRGRACARTTGLRRALLESSRRRRAASGSTPTRA